MCVETVCDDYIWLVGNVGVDARLVPRHLLGLSAVPGADCDSTT
jgi:hypothetical protein